MLGAEDDREAETKLLRRACAGLASLGAAVALVLASGTPAAADISNDPGSGQDFGLRAVDVVVTSGAGDPVSTGTMSVSVPPKCWWEPFNLENLSFVDDIKKPKSPGAMKKYFEWSADHQHSYSRFSIWSYPSEKELNRIAQLERQGQDHTWYSLESAPGVNCADEGYVPSGGQGPEGLPGSGAVPLSYRAFPAGAEPDPPLVDVQDVVEMVWDEASASVAGPDLGRNPKIQGAGGATLINLPTWFWVQNVQAALAGDGKIHLEVSIPGTPVQATLDASTNGVQITSPAGATQCSVAEAKTEWTASAATGSACTIGFNQTNRAGWPVTAQTTWTGSWTGTDHNGTVGGDLQTLTPSAQTEVPVVASQALVNDVD